MMIKRSAVSSDIERKIVIGLITDDEYCSQVQRMSRSDYFKSDYARIVSKWIAEYWKTYKKAPKNSIKDIYDSEKGLMKESEASVVGAFLSSISELYESADQQNFVYLEDQTREYFRERALSLMSDRVSALMLRGRYDEAEQEIKGFHKVAKETSQWYNPLDKINVYDMYNTNDEDLLFSMPSDLGKLIGPFRRDWLVAFMGPMKRGKSWYLQEIAIQALTNGLKVAYISLEMNKNTMSKRLYHRMTAMAEVAGRYLYPVYDCNYNQANTCRLAARKCRIGIKESLEEDTPLFAEITGYEACAVCKTEGNSKSYSPAVWCRAKQQSRDMEPKDVIRKTNDFRKLYGDNLRVVAFPAFSATMDDIEVSLDDLEYTDNFVPDVICIDYFDITAPEDRQLSERGAADRVWKRGKGLATKRHALVATVLQSNRGSIDKKNLAQQDTGEDIRKLAHVDVMAGLNQDEKFDKKHGIMRISIIAHRHKDFTVKGKDVIVLQNLELGQPLME